MAAIDLWNPTTAQYEPAQSAGGGKLKIDIGQVDATVVVASANANAQTAVEGTNVALSTNLNRQLRVILSDPITPANNVTVSQIHNADQQTVAGTAQSIFTAGVSQLQSPVTASGFVDRAREGGVDNASPIGMAAGTTNLAMAFKTSSTGNYASGVTSIVVAAVTGIVGGGTWTIKQGTKLIIDTGAAQETVDVTSVNSGTKTVTFAPATVNAHNGSVTPFIVTGFVLNQERDACGEQDAASGVGGTPAFEMEFNGGDPAGFNFDRARNVQSLGVTNYTISSGGTQNSTSIVLSSAPPASGIGSLQAGQKCLLVDASFPTTGHFETINVDLSYVAGSTTVPLASAIANATTYTTLKINSHVAKGPDVNGFLPIGLGIEEEAVYDPVTGLFYLERSATQDGVSAQNVVIESPGLWNGTTIDRAKSASAANIAGQSGIGAEMVASVGNWSVNSFPATATQATAVKAAGAAGVRHICTGVSFGFSQPAVAVGFQGNIQILDGATVIWQQAFACPATANQAVNVNINGLSLVGTAATSMTAQFNAAGGASTQESAVLMGYDVS